MIRWIAASTGALAVTLALGLAVPFANHAKADGIERPVYRPVYHRHIRCIAPATWFTRAQTTWVCSAGERCCYDRVLRKGSCLPASQRCF
jgi:hypothetical protein